jgi:RNA polymerase-binding transcription factor DksA
MRSATLRREIGWERLAAQPQARRCVACEAAREVRGPRRPTL